MSKKPSKASKEGEQGAIWNEAIETDEITDEIISLEPDEPEMQKIQSNPIFTHFCSSNSR
jgi:hypothetical protein